MDNHVPVVPEQSQPVVWEAYLTGISRRNAVIEYGANRTIYMQGQPADSVFFVLRGKVKLTVASRDGKEAIVATLGAGEFFGEGCLGGQPVRTATAITMGACTLTRVETPLMARMLREEHGLAEVFATQLVSRTLRYEADLADHLLNPSEKRLARILLLLSRCGNDSTTETEVTGLNQEHLAQMVGTTRSRINSFMNKFRDLGYIEYGSDAGVTVHRRPLSVFLRDSAREGIDTSDRTPYTGGRGDGHARNRATTAVDRARGSARFARRSVLSAA